MVRASGGYRGRQSSDTRFDEIHATDWKSWLAAKTFGAPLMDSTRSSKADGRLRGGRSGRECDRPASLLAGGAHGQRRSLTRQPPCFVLVFPDNRPRHANTSAYEFQYRERKGGDSKSIYPPQDAGPPAFPVDSPHAWLRLKASSAATGKTGRSTVPTRSIYRRLYFWAWR